MNSQLGQIFPFLVKHRDNQPEILEGSLDCLEKDGYYEDEWLAAALQELKDQGRTFKREQGEIWDWLARANQHQKEHETKLSEALIETHRTAAIVVALQEAVDKEIERHSDPQFSEQNQQIIETLRSEKIYLSDRLTDIQNTHQKLIEKSIEVQERQAIQEKVIHDLSENLAENHSHHQTLAARFEQTVETVDGLQEQQDNQDQNIEGLIEKLAETHSHQQALTTLFEQTVETVDGLQVQQDSQAQNIEGLTENLVETHSHQQALTTLFEQTVETVADIQAQQDSQAQNIKGLTEKLTKTRSRQRALSTRFEQTVETVGGLQKQQDSQAQNIEGLTEKLAEAHSHHQTLAARFEQTVETVGGLQKQQDSQAQNIEGLTEKLAEAHSHHQTLAARFEQTVETVGGLQKQQDSQAQNIEGLTEKLAEAHSHHQTLAARFEQTVETVGGLQKQQDDQAQNIEGLTEKLAETRSSQQQLSYAVKGIFNTLNQHGDQFEKSQRDHQEKLEAFEANLSSKQTSLDNLRQTVDRTAGLAQGLCGNQNQIRGHINILIKEALQVQSTLGNISSAQKDQSRRLMDVGSHLVKLEQQHKLDNEKLTEKQHQLSLQFGKVAEQVNDLQKIQAKDSQQLTQGLAETRSEQQALSERLEKLRTLGLEEFERGMSQVLRETRSGFGSIQEELASLEDRQDQFDQHQSLLTQGVSEIRALREGDLDRLSRLEMNFNALREAQEFILKDAKARNKRVQQLQQVIGTMVANQEELAGLSQRGLERSRQVLRGELLTPPPRR